MANIIFILLMQDQSLTAEVIEVTLDLHCYTWEQDFTDDLQKD